MDGVVNTAVDQTAYAQQNGTDLQVTPATHDDSSESSGKEERIYKPFNKKQLTELVAEANKTLETKQTNLHYVLHDKLHQYYVQIEDSVTHQVLREIPPKKMMDMYAAIAEKLGLIVNKRI